MWLLAHVNHRLEGHTAQQLISHNITAPGARRGIGSPWARMRPNQARVAPQIALLFLCQINPRPVPTVLPMECHMLHGTGYSLGGVGRSGPLHI